MKPMVAIGVVGVVLAASTASASRLDVMTPGRAGPIRRGETTMRQMRRWFGDPTARRVRRVGCVRVVSARWGDKLKVYASRGRSGAVEALFVRSPRLTSDRHGELNIHTRKGLRVGDRERKLRRLYPRRRPITHAGHTHYRLQTSPNGSHLMAKAVRHRIVQLEAWPFEFC